MAYLGLARKWRPQTFDDLVGQGHIARTISNAIKADRVSQGYLFTGTRGIGKTSAARIFAKALRCQAAKEPGIPCGKCTDCIEIAEGRSVDVLEIDGASNNGVDAVREIRENAKYLPSSGKYKIYIIDEVHMLTTAAFNALLKTLEEPPAHVLFIFATTDPQKIPATVLSRCQRFDFKRVSQKDLAARLKFICDSEKVTISADALSMLAREAEGSMRDAVSLLDQILAVGGKQIDGKAITEALGLVDKQTILDCMTGILQRKPLEAVEAVGKVYLHGFDLKQFGREILRYLRQIMVARLLEQKTGDNLNAYLDVSDVDLADVKNLMNARPLEELDMLFRMLNHGLEDVARSPIPKMVMDVLVIKMATADDAISINDLSPETLGGIGAASVGKPQAAPSARSALGAAVVSGRSPDAQYEVTASAAPPINAAKEALKAAVDAAKKGPAKPPASAIANSAPAPQAVASQTAAASELNTQWWAQAVAFVKAQKPLVGSIIEHMGFEGAEQTDSIIVVRLGFTKDTSFYKDQLQSKAYVDLLGLLLKNYLGRAVRLDYKEVLSSKSLGQLEEDRRKAQADERRKTVLDSEAMRATQQLLGARLEKLDITPERKL